MLFEDRYIIQYIKQEPNMSNETSENQGQPIAKQTDTFAIITLVTAILGALLFPLAIICVPISIICAWISYYKIRENEHLKGEGLRLAGALVNVANVIFIYNIYF
jgi:hypothetical protein